MTGYVYILSNRPQGVLYIGVTSDLVKRVFEHRDGKIKGFSQKYNVKSLVYFEEFSSIEEAILRETQLKKWRRAWKIKIIEEKNPQWIDVYPTVCG